MNIYDYGFKFYTPYAISFACIIPGMNSLNSMNLILHSGI
jgi:hypothetical protein